MIVAGIDPGKSGAIAIIDDKLNVILLVDMPTTNESYVSVIKNNRYKTDKTFLEDVHALPKQSSVAGFTFGKNVGKAELIAETIGNVCLVSPSKWKKELGLIKREGETKVQHKHRSIELAKKLFKDVEKKLTASKDGRAEALLIAYYGIKQK